MASSKSNNTYKKRSTFNRKRKNFKIDYRSFFFFFKKRLLDILDKRVKLRLCELY